MTAYLDGEAAAFDALFGRYHGHVRSVCLRFFGDATLADDLVQETFYNVVRSLARVERGFNVAGWIHRIAVNVCQDEVRRRDRRGAHAAPAGGDPDGTILRIPDDDSSGDPEAALELAGLRQLVWEVAKLLPERQRMVLTLRELRGLSYASIGRVMGTTDAAVETLLHRARRRFKEEYLRLEWPPEELISCAVLAFLMTRAKLGSSERRAAAAHLEVCATCAVANDTPPALRTAALAV